MRNLIRNQIAHAIIVLATFGSTAAAQWVNASLHFTSALSVLGRRQVCGDDTCPPAKTCVLVPGGQACCQNPRTCRAVGGSCSEGLVVCPGLIDFCCDSGSRCALCSDGVTYCVSPNDTSPDICGGVLTTASSTPTPASSSISSINPTSTEPTRTTIIPAPSSSETVRSNSTVIEYHPSGPGWFPTRSNSTVAGEPIPKCAENSEGRSTEIVNATISFNATGSRFVVRVIKHPTGGPYTVSFKNTSQTFNASSGSGRSACGPGTSLERRGESLDNNVGRFAFDPWAVRGELAKRDDNESGELVITNLHEGGFHFLDVVVYRSIPGVVVVPASARSDAAHRLRRGRQTSIYNILGLVIWLIASYC